jgi:prepilin-type N-terminal cleavage/methylation domain-containing protein/prepilin-type processing-associated H-X9-DG protein
MMCRSKYLAIRQSGLLPVRDRRNFSEQAGFTLIELLVVIAIIALLLAILVPTLQQVRKQTKAVVCQSFLKQWGAIWATYTQDNDGSLPSRNWYTDRPWNVVRDPLIWWGWGGDSKSLDMEECSRVADIMCCPLATKPAQSTCSYNINPSGGTFLAWGRLWPEEFTLPNGYGSYGVNFFVYWSGFANEEYKHSQSHWRTSDVKGAYNVPIYLDSCWIGTDMGWFGAPAPPPKRDAVPTSVGPDDHPMSKPGGIRCFCIDRHDGYVNGLFMDWSVRKVGLKELWTLRWHREFDTANDWTKAGGIKPEDWPEWMRGFRDY